MDFHSSILQFLILVFISNELDAYKPFAQDPTQNFITHRKIPALEYLGCGYDVLYGNPLPSTESLVDPGYRNPILSYTLVDVEENGIKRMEYAKITGAWIRPLVECKRSDEKTVVRTMDEYMKAAGLDVEISASKALDDSVRFTMSGGYSELKEALSSNKSTIVIQRSYCFLLEAGIPLHAKW
ncbi:Membrane attack complex component-perforin (MACPF) domain [Babesia duncani]|uniref:Membrane attack complex component-perforin (MACPF) domain n=1 Tax=Babesia duncani TaxID=323732 RepID=A0AAD9PK14_9APIC|nr:Membrane attack complex component-perforin (MACPF) domain [Babesia duncani]